MTFAPPTIAALAAYWKSQQGVNLGIVGDTAHLTRGTSYHLGQDDLLPGAYSAQLPRDREPALTNAAAAIDLGKLKDSYTELRRFSEWLVTQALAGKCRDIREVIYCTSDGQYIKRWSGPDNKVYTSMHKTSSGWQVVTPGNGDSSHATHTHISFYRDSEFREKVSLFQPYFEEMMAGLAVALAVTMDANPWDALGTATLPAATSVRRVRDDARIPLPAGTNLGVVQRGNLRNADGTVGASIVMFNHAGESHLTGFGQVKYVALVPPATTTIPAYPDVRPQLAQATTDLGKANAKIAAMETAEDNIAVELEANAAKLRQK